MDPSPKRAYRSGEGSKTIKYNKRSKRPNKRAKRPSAAVVSYQIVARPSSYFLRNAQPRQSQPQLSLSATTTGITTLPVADESPPRDQCESLAQGLQVQCSESTATGMYIPLSANANVFSRDSESNPGSGRQVYGSLICKVD